jgi:hypothetical protein
MHLVSKSKKYRVSVAGICLLVLVFNLPQSQAISPTFHPTIFSEDWTLQVGSSSSEYVLEVEALENTTGVISMGFVKLDTVNEYYIVRVTENGSILWTYEHLLVTEEAFLAGLFVDEINNRVFSLLTERNSTSYTLFLLVLELTDGTEVLKMHLDDEMTTSIGKFAINPANSSQVFVSYSHYFNSHVVACDLSTETIYWQKEITPYYFNVEIISMYYSASNGKLYLGLQDNKEGFYVEKYNSSRLMSMIPGSPQLATLEILTFEGNGCLFLSGFHIVDDVLYVLGLQEDIEDSYTYALKIMELDFSESNLLYFHSFARNSILMAGELYSSSFLEPGDPVATRIMVGVVQYLEGEDLYEFTGSKYYGYSDASTFLRDIAYYDNTFYMGGSGKLFVAGSFNGFLAKFSNILSDPNYCETETPSETADFLDNFLKTFTSNSNWAGLGATAILSFLIGGLLFSLLKRK